MPLIILGLLLVIGLLAYSIVRYINSGEEDTRPVRERYPKAFQRIMKDDTDDGQGSSDRGTDQEDDDQPIHAKAFVDTDNLRGDLDYIFRNLKDNISEKAREHGIDLEKLGRDPSKHNPFSDNKKPSAEPDQNNWSDADDDQADADIEKDDSTIIFPTDNVEAEKSKRNIHSDK